MNPNGRRQGNPQLGFEICPHTCGCLISEAAANRSRRKPVWMKKAPLALKDGHHLVNHIKTTEVHPNCSANCSKFQIPPRDLTHEEWTAWVPHLGHYTPFARHIPPKYKFLIPATPLEDNYDPVFPTHPLPLPLAPSLQHGLASMSIQWGPSTSANPSTSAGTSTGPPLPWGQSTSASGPSRPSLPGPSSATSLNDLGGEPKLLFVETPRLSTMNVVDVEGTKNLFVYGDYLAPITTKQGKENYKLLRKAPKNMAFQVEIEDDDESPNVITFRIHDLMVWVLAFKERGWRVKWMTWEIFREAVLGKKYEIFEEFTLIAGGFSLATDYITAHPGLDESNVDNFWVRLLKLSRKTPMFPHPQDLLNSGCKIQRDNDLMIAATSATLTPYPRSMTMVNLEEITALSANQGVVIKRDYSDSDNCTFLPTRRRASLVESKFWETKSKYSQVKNLPFPSWLAQPYIPSLVHKGELRAYVVGGKFMYAIHTWKQRDGKMKTQVAENFTPLELLDSGSTPHLGPLLSTGATTTSLCNERLTEVQNAQGLAVFKDFVERTVKAMIDLENSRRGDQSSSLQVFCRVDVGVLFLGGACHYYVNELERSLTTGLFRIDGFIGTLTMLDSAVKSIPSYISGTRKG